jgi:hypothetical protein
MPHSATPIYGLTFVSPSSFAVPVQPAALELLTALAPVLERWGRWYLFGAQAVTLQWRTVSERRRRRDAGPEA